MCFCHRSPLFLRSHWIDYLGRLLPRPGLPCLPPASVLPARRAEPQLSPLAVRSLSVA